MMHQLPNWEIEQACLFFHLSEVTQSIQEIPDIQVRLAMIDREQSNANAPTHRVQLLMLSWPLVMD